MIGAARPGMDFDIAIVTIRFTGKQRLNLVGIGPGGKRRERIEAGRVHEAVDVIEDEHTRSPSPVQLGCEAGYGHGEDP